MVIHAQYREVGNELIAFVPCERCGAIIGRLTVDEVVALSTGKYGPVLCFDCEEQSCAWCKKELTEREKQENHRDERGNAICWYCLAEAEKVMNLEVA